MPLASASTIRTRSRCGGRRKPNQIDWLLRSPTGGSAERFADPARFCSALRRALEGVATAAELTQFWSQHDAALAALRQVPQLTNERGVSTMPKSWRRSTASA